MKTVSKIHYHHRTQLLSCNVLSLLVVLLLGGVAVGNAQPVESESFFEMVRNNNLQDVKAQLLMSADASMKNANGHTALMFAVNEGHIEMMKMLLNFGADPNMKDRFGQTALMYAAVRGDTALTGPLLRRNAEINATNHKDKSALTLASREGHTEVVQQLLFEGAEVNHQDVYGWSAMHFASFKKEYEIVDLLIKFSADVMLEDGEGKIPMIYAAAGGYLNIVERLGEKMSRNQLNNTDQNGWTPIHYAAFNGRSKVVTYLVNQGVDHSLTTAEGHTILDFARKSGNKTLISYIQKIQR